MGTHRETLTHMHMAPSKPAFLNWRVTVPRGTFDTKAWRHLRFLVDEALECQCRQQLVSGQTCSSVP